MMAGRVVGTDTGVGVLGRAAEAGVLMGAADLVAWIAGSAGAGAMVGTLDAITGASVGGIARSVDGGRGSADASSGRGVCTSSGRSASNGRRGRFFLRGGL